AEDRGVRADADREREDRDRREYRRLAEHANAMAKVVAPGGHTSNCVVGSRDAPSGDTVFTFRTRPRTSCRPIPRESWHSASHCLAQFTRACWPRRWCRRATSPNETSRRLTSLATHS